jgi:hypothetical protein
MPTYSFRRRGGTDAVKGIRLRAREVGTDRLSEKEERNGFQFGLLYSIANLTLNDMNY